MTLTTPSSLLSIEDLSIAFRSARGLSLAVKNVSLDVRPKETVCLVGESGCGKTVTALSILGLLPSPPGEISEGSIRFKGENLLDYSEEAFQKVRGHRIAMIFQEPLTSLNPVFTIGHQIQETIDLHLHLHPVEAFEKSVELLSDVGIPDPLERMNDYPHQLSGGQRQRAMIAMALSCDPSLLIADEPTTALDVTVQSQILALLKTAQRSRGMSILYITHDLRVVSGIADRVFVMYSGVIVEQGQTKHIFEQSKHPYTEGLLASLPTREKRGMRLYSIPGAVPDPEHRPPGCPFHPRCLIAINTCEWEFPALHDYGDGHLARCPVIAKLKP
jgi:oligopeptide/dipeptide ABC transporter ATP-binding protein